MNALDGLAATHSVGGKMVAADSLYRVLLDLQRRRLEVDSLSGMVVARTLGSLGQYRRATQIYTLSGEFPIENARVLRRSGRPMMGS